MPSESYGNVRLEDVYPDGQPSAFNSLLQDSLIGVALKWYMGLNSAKTRTFNDLGEAFIRQYKYNLDMAPNRDQLRAISKKEKDCFKEYA